MGHVVTQEYSKVAPKAYLYKQRSEKWSVVNIHAIQVYILDYIKYKIHNKNIELHVHIIFFP